MVLEPVVEVRPEQSPPQAVPPLRIEGLSVAYHRRPVLWDVNYTSPSSGLVAIVGPNGAGKSTLIKACLGLVPRMAGTVEVFGKPLAKQRRRIGYLPQRGSVDWDFPVSALDVVAMGLYGSIGWFLPVSRKIRAQAMENLDQVGMADYAKRQIGQLSGGQQQRVFLARALAQNADLYFMDEPFAGVDAATEAAVLRVLDELNRQGKAVICVHHDLQTVADHFEHALLLNTRVIAEGPVEETMTMDKLQYAFGGKILGGESPVGEIALGTRA